MSTDHPPSAPPAGSAGPTSQPPPLYSLDSQTDLNQVSGSKQDVNRSTRHSSMSSTGSHIITRRNYMFFAFKNEEIERQYERWYMEENITTWRVIMIAMFLAQLISYMFRWILYPPESEASVARSDWLKAEAAGPGSGPLYDELRQNSEYYHLACSGNLCLAACGSGSFCGPYNLGLDALLAIFFVCIPGFGVLLASFLFPRHLFARYMQAFTAAVLFLTSAGGILLRSFLVETYFTPLDGIYTTMTIGMLPLVLKAAPVYTVASQLGCFVLLLVLNIGRTSTIYGTHYPTTSPLLWSGLVLFFSMAAAVVILSEHQANSRKDFLETLRLARANHRLQQRLLGLRKDFGAQAADLDSPLEKSINRIKAVLANPRLDPDSYRDLLETVDLLSSPDLLTPDLAKQFQGGQNKISNDTAAWLFNEIVPHALKKTPLAGALNPASSDATGRVRPATGDGAATNSAGGTSSHALAASDLAMHGPATPLTPLARPQRDKIDLMLAQMGDWNFDMFALDDLTGGHPLFAVCDQVVRGTGVLDRLGLDDLKWVTFLQEVERGYHRDLTYHNNIHAADVVHSVHWILSQPAVALGITDLERLGAVVAAAIHDFDHPGFNNSFLVASRHPMAILYNDRSVLENHHLAAAFALLTIPENNFLDVLPEADYRALRASIVDMVLATDLAQHFNMLSLVKNKVLVSMNYNWRNVTEDRALFWKMAIKFGDVSNSSKSEPIYRKWMFAVLEEFFNQGDRERELGVPISPFMDRGTCNIAACQTGFMDFICQPLLEVIHVVVPMPQAVEQFAYNRNRWNDAKVVSAVQTQSKASSHSMQGAKQSLSSLRK